MNTTVSETTTVKATKQPVQPSVVRSELPDNATVSVTKSINTVTGPVQPSELPPDALQEYVLGRLLRMADTLYRSGEVRQAKSMFSRLREEYPASLEGEQASEHLIELAEQYEREGNLRQARSIYEELL